MWNQSRKPAALLFSLVVLVCVAVGGTAAFLTARGQAVNTFAPGTVGAQVTEDFDGTVKKNVNVINTGNAEAYLRVRLIGYRVNAQGQRIGGTAAIPTFTPGENWVPYGEYYYYTLPVAAGQAPAAPLIGESGITLMQYTDADGGLQVIEVVAEAVQSSPARAVGQSWGVAIAPGSVTAYPASSEG